VILFVAAEPRECEPWVGHWSSVHPAKLPVHWARAGTWKGSDVMAIANGAGPERARAAVSAAPLPTAVCNIGFCGALDGSLRIGDIFVATEVRNGSRTYPAQDPHGSAPGKAGPLASQPHIARTAAEKRRLRNSGAFAVEMEAAGVAGASERLNVPFYCIRAVSDLADEDLANDLTAISCRMDDSILGACCSAPAPAP